jgi:hypothetical protein
MVREEEQEFHDVQVCLLVYYFPSQMVLGKIPAQVSASFTTGRLIDIIEKVNRNGRSRLSDLRFKGVGSTL